MITEEECSVVKNLQKHGIECKSILRKKYTEENIIELLKILQVDPSGCIHS